MILLLCCKHFSFIRGCLLDDDINDDLKELFDVEGNPGWLSYLTFGIYSSGQSNEEKITDVDKMPTELEKEFEKKDDETGGFLSAIYCSSCDYFKNLNLFNRSADLLEKMELFISVSVLYCSLMMYDSYFKAKGYYNRSKKWFSSYFSEYLDLYNIITGKNSLKGEVLPIKKNTKNDPEEIKKQADITKKPREKLEKDKSEPINHQREFLDNPSTPLDELIDELRQGSESINKSESLIESEEPYTEVRGNLNNQGYKPEQDDNSDDSSLFSKRNIRWLAIFAICCLSVYFLFKNRDIIMKWF